MRHRFVPLQAWMAWVLPRPYVVLGMAFAMALASVAVTVSKLDMETGQLDLISPKHPLIRLTERLKPFESKDTFTVVIQPSTPREGVAFLRALLSRLQADPDHYKDILFRVDPELFRPWALLYLDEADLRRIRDRLHAYRPLIQGIAAEPDLLNFLRLVNQEMARRMVGQLFTGFLDERHSQPGEPRQSEPMDLAFLIKTLESISDYVAGSSTYRSPWGDFFGNGGWERDLEGYFWVNKKRFLLMFVTPKRSSETFNRARASLEHLREAIQQVRVSFPEVHAGVTGQEALKADEMTVALRDMSRATWLALLGACGLMVLFLRTLGRPLIEMVSLGVGMCWTFGWATLAIGHLNILSMVFAPLLSGLGVDYGIHWFSRYEEEERDHGQPAQEVIRRVVDRSGPGIFLAGLTAALSFFPLVLTGFKGLVELGLITGMGILFTLLADFSVLPALNLLFPGQKRVKAARRPPGRGRDLIRLHRRTARRVLAGAVILCLLSGWGATRVRFDLNPLRLQAKGTESVVWEEKLLQNSKRSVMYASLLASSPQEVREKTKALEHLASVSEVESVLSLLPEDQKRKIPLLRSLGDALPHLPSASPRRLRVDLQALIEVLQRIRFKMQDDQADQWGAQRPMVEQIRRVRALIGVILRTLGDEPDGEGPLMAFNQRFQEDLLDVLHLIVLGVRADPMEVDDLPGFLRDRVLRDGHYLIRVYPGEYVWEREPLARFVRDLRSVDPLVAGDPVTLYDFTFAFRKACVEASIYALAAILLLLLVTMRGVLLPILALIPLLVGTLWVLGIMGLAGIPFNLANTIFLPLIVGAGVEYGVIILHRWQEGRMRPGHLPLSTAKGVVLAALTTTVGFGSLMISRHQGIFSLGFLALTGSLCVLLAAIVVLPAILSGFSPPKIHPEKEV